MMLKNKRRQQNGKPHGWHSRFSVFSMDQRTDLLKAIFSVFPAHVDWSVIHICKRKKDESVADCKAGLEALFLRHFKFHTINKVT